MAGAASSPSIAASGRIELSLFDGTRRLMPAGLDSLITLRDSRQREIRIERPGPSFELENIPLDDGAAGPFAVIAYVKGYQQAGFYPVHVGAGQQTAVDLMLLPESAQFNFAAASWPDIQANKQKLAVVIETSVSDAPSFYRRLMQQQPAPLACLLNLVTAMDQIFLPQGTPLDYWVALEADDLRQDRCFAWVRPELQQQVDRAARQSRFSRQPEIDLLLHRDPRYGPATSSYKQIAFGEANLQFTFHEHTQRSIAGRTCILLEPDIDYYKDTGAHLVLEVLPHLLTGVLTDPKHVYMLRWQAGRHAGTPEFNPLYTLE